jgi:uncharacterized MAPEG superfamily protein
MSASGVVFAVAFVALYAAHEVADHWVQTHHQSMAKGLPGWRGRAACARHVASYTVTQVLALLATAAVTGARSSLLAVAAGVALSALSHYWADRKTTLAALAGCLRRFGKDGFYRLGMPRPGHDDNPSLGTGAYALDQSFHVLFLFAAALVIAGGAS